MIQKKESNFQYSAEVVSKIFEDILDNVHLAALHKFLIVKNSKWCRQAYFQGIIEIENAFSEDKLGQPFFENQIEDCEPPVKVKEPKIIIKKITKDIEVQKHKEIKKKHENNVSYAQQIIFKSMSQIKFERKKNFKGSRVALSTHSIMTNAPNIEQKRQEKLKPKRVYQPYIPKPQNLENYYGVPIVISSQVCNKITVKNNNRIKQKQYTLKLGTKNQGKSKKKTLLPYNNNKSFRQSYLGRERPKIKSQVSKKRMEQIILDHKIEKEKERNRKSIQKVIEQKRIKEKRKIEDNVYVNHQKMLKHFPQITKKTRQNSIYLKL